MIKMLLKAYFVENRFIGDIEVLVDIAREAGLDADAAREAVADLALRRRAQSRRFDQRRHGLRERERHETEDEELPEALRHEEERRVRKDCRKRDDLQRRGDEYSRPQLWRAKSYPANPQSFD